MTWNPPKWRGRVRCLTCHGSGWVPYGNTTTTKTECPECEGHGYGRTLP